MLDHQKGVTVPQRPPSDLIDQNLVVAVVIRRVGKDQVEFSKVSLQKRFGFSTDQLQPFRADGIRKGTDEVDGLGIGIHRQHKRA
ncbi:MAG: Uncharacterised protein [Flavobacteriia bacterium]|nr:MAG: Uncharacterised protein [Flavobacteriia bacterium]